MLKVNFSCSDCHLVIYVPIIIKMIKGNNVSTQEIHIQLIYKESVAEIFGMHCT